jgi:hypothetical protein
VFIEIAKVSAKHNLASLRVRFARYWRALPLVTRGSSTHIIVGAGGIASGGAVGRARVSLGLPPNATMEDRIARLEALAKVADDQIAALAARVEAEELARATAISAEAALREQGDAGLHGRIRDVETGGLDLSLFGVAWVLVGTILSTANVELCCALPRGP